MKFFTVTKLGPAVLALALGLTGCVTNPNPNPHPRPRPHPSPYSHQVNRRAPVVRVATPPKVVVSENKIAEPTAGDLPPMAVTEIPSEQVTPLVAPADLWERIRRGFAIPDLTGNLVDKWQNWYLSRPDYLDRMTDRSQLYIFHVVEELELRRMPTELALLPFIESAFNPQALSSARAAGMWQFMPATGNTYELRQNMLRDDRRDVIASTRAALDYLQKLHDQFGDWQLALAAYNWGENGVEHAIDKNRAAGLPTDYEHLSMPAETRNYVPKLQAIKNIIAHPEAFGITLPLIENHPFFDTVSITQDIDVSTVARLAQIRLEDFKALNPSLKKPVIFAAGTPQILLPWDNVAIFKENLAKQPPGTLASWTIWVAPSTLTPAKAAQMVNVREAELRAINNIPHGMLVKRGSTLLVPRQDSAPAAAPQQEVDNARLALAPDIVLKPLVIRARGGDTIARVAARYDLPAATVARWNGRSAATRLTRWEPVTLYLPVRSARSHTTTRRRPPAGHQAGYGPHRRGTHAHTVARFARIRTELSKTGREKRSSE
ncbi:MAG: transglycosylase SLT domain-containing protein [Burkholderiaceae bacterium]|nr:transglycosylase SLT domain-containing protein [Burkholderiaceae bacterium]